MYTLTLTPEDRKAIDWIGNRYSNGEDLKLLLCDGCIDYKDNAWSSKHDITFYLPEYIAWQIADNAREEDGDLEYNFPCFSRELTEKLYTFCLEIV